MNESIFKFGKEQMEELAQKIHGLGNIQLTPVAVGNIYFRCGDNSCAQSCSGGCGKDCSAFFSECVVKV